MDQAHIFQINVSDGGVPKRAVRVAEVGFLGLAGDRQDDTEHHGGPERALCFFPLEHILALQAEGHPIFPGAIGENITVVGLDWGRAVPGARLRVGEQALVEITSYTTPCRTIQGSFDGQHYGRVSQKANPGWSRVYARVLTPGLLRTGDGIQWVG